MDMGGGIGVVGDVIRIKMALIRIHKKLCITISCICF